MVPDVEDIYRPGSDACETGLDSPVSECHGRHWLVTGSPRFPVHLHEMETKLTI